MPPEASIVIRTLNESKYLENLLKGIHGQNHRDWEIVLVDSGSTDGTRDIAARYGARIFHIPKDEFTFGRSLNIGCREAKGKYLVFVSGHVWPITNNWLANLLKPFAESAVAMVYGRQRGTGNNSLSESRDLEMLFGGVSHILVDEPKGNNGNAAIRRDLWSEQPFDESLTGLEDVDWARNIEAKNYRVYYAADAPVYHVHEESLKQIYNRHFREAIATKRMFPHNKFSVFDVVKGLPYFIMRDLLFAVRRKQLRKLALVPGVRTVQFMGIYRGLRFHRRLAAEASRNLEIPDSYRAVVVDPVARQHGIHELKLPELLPGQVLVRVAFVGVCPGDQDGAGVGSGGSEPKEPAGSFVPGDEFSGVVAKTGAKVGGLKEGTKVVGRVRPKDAPTGAEQKPKDNPSGSYAEYLVLPADQLQPVPQDITLKHAVLMRPLAACMEGIRQLEVKGGLKACVIGAGPEGNLCAQLLRARGLHVTAVDGNTQWLSQLAGHDINTLEHPENMETFDYVLINKSDRGLLKELAETPEPFSKLFLFESATLQSQDTLDSGSYDAVNWPVGKVFRSTAQCSEDWAEAIRSVRAGSIDLKNHSATVKPLDAYEQAWAGIERLEHFKVLLSVTPHLEHV